MTKAPTITFHGAAHTVTGSCMQFTSGGKSILVDCGMFQGSRSLEILNSGKFDFDPQDIVAVVLTHAHIDHSGLLPKLVARGFNGKIWCTRPTSDLLQFMLADAGRIQEFDIRRRNRRRDRAGEEPFEPLYTEENGLAAWRLCQPVDLEEWFEPAPGFRVRLWNAGHILGSASAELQIDDVHLICSGDIGPENKAFLADPAGPHGFDYVISETTYGDRDREEVTNEQRRSLLETEAKGAIARGGNLIIPAFALERTQELLLDLALLKKSGALPGVQVFVDSPLANQATSVFEKYSAGLEDTGGENIFKNPAFHYVNDVGESMRLNTVSGAIILAASGMCEGGRIRHHLMHNLHRRESTVLFVGFQAQGTLGRVILEGAKTVRISGSDVRVQAQIRKIDSYSAHADQSELVEWIEDRLPISGNLFLSHGEPGSLEAMRLKLKARDTALTVILPEIGETYILQPATRAKRSVTGRMDVQQALGRDWQNSYADFATNLKSELRQIADKRQRQKAIEEMRKVLKSYADAKRGRRN